MDRPRPAYRLAAVLACGALLLAATAEAVVNPRPTTTAITHWKRIVLKPAYLPNWWKGYLGGPTHLTSCKYMTTKGVLFYDCKIANRIDNSNTLAFAALVRVSRCGYAYTLSSTHGTRSFTRRFKLCPS
jgi:hypothetical protein